jgi:multidrug efflux pump subunit AcrB
MRRTVDHEPRPAKCSAFASTPSQIQKVDGNEHVIMWLNVVGEEMSVPALTDYPRRHLVDRFSVLKGVARVRVRGNQTYALRVWIDRNALAARSLVPNVCSLTPTVCSEIPIVSLWPN